MPHVLTLNNINDSDLPKVGYRSLDFAKIFQAKFNTPLSFVVPNIVFEEFVVQTGLSHGIRAALDEAKYDDPLSLKDVYHKIKKLIEDTNFPEELIEPLKEAYNSLAVGAEKKAASDFLSEDEPVVNLIASPDYLMGTEDLFGLIFNLSGFDNFLLGLKSCWLSLYSPESLLLRWRKGIKSFNAGVLVQRFINVEATAEAYSKGPLGDYELIVHAYLGLPDILKSSSKDFFSISKEYLNVETSKKARQEYKIARGYSDNKIIKTSLGTRGAEQKLSDKEVIEVARLTKRMYVVYNFHFKSYFLIRKGTPYFFLVSRYPEEVKTSEQTKESAPVVAPSETKVIVQEEKTEFVEPTEDLDDDSEDYADVQEDETDEFVEPTEESDPEEKGEKIDSQEEFVNEYSQNEVEDSEPEQEVAEVQEDDNIETQNEYEQTPQQEPEIEVEKEEKVEQYTESSDSYEEPETEETSDSEPEEEVLIEPEEPKEDDSDEDEFIFSESEDEEKEENKFN